MTTRPISTYPKRCGGQGQDVTERQRAIFDHYLTHILEHQRPPTVREMMAEFGIKSPNGVVSHLDALVRKGLLEVDGHTEGGFRYLKIAGAKLAFIDEDATTDSGYVVESAAAD